MNDLKLLTLWLSLGWFLVLLIVFFSLWPEPPEVVTFEQGDKLGHLVAYMGLMLWFSNIYPGKNQRICLAILFFAMGAVLEFIQRVTAYRSLEVTDMIVNGLGITVGWFLAGSWPGNFLVRLDKGLVRVRLKFIKPARWGE